VSPESAARTNPVLADGAGAALVVLVYALLGPIIGGVLIFPIGALALHEFRPDLTLLGVVATLGSFPMSAVMAYLLAGVPALATGVVIGAIFYRSGGASVRQAILAPVFVYLSLAVLDQLLGIAIPGAAMVRGSGSGGTVLWLAVSIAASVLCWLVTLPIQRRMR
jgi:hypothetical protein